MMITAILRILPGVALQLGKHSRETEFEEGERHLGEKQFKESD